VQAIVREFEKFPPALLEEPKSPKSMEPSDKGIYDLSVLSVDQLRLMNDDIDYLDDFISNLTCIKNLYDDLNNLVLQVEHLACANLTKKEQIEDNTQRLEVMYDQFKELGVKYEESSQKYQRKAEEFSPQNIKELLQASASNSDAICEDEAQKFLAGDNDVTTFLKRYMDAKKSSALRKAKEERLVQQLSYLEKSKNYL
jgi:ESCRT-I complex subunit VPS37